MAPARPRRAGAHRRARHSHLSEADETEVEIDVAADALTRFANNTIHQNVAEQILGISVRAVVDGRTARATTNKTDEESLRRVVAAAVSLARNQPENPDLLPMLGPQKYQKVEPLFPLHSRGNSARPRPRRRARLPNRRENTSQTAAGIFSTGSMQSCWQIPGDFSRTTSRRARNFPSPFWKTILPAGPRRTPRTSLRSIPTRWPKAPAAKRPRSRKPRELAPGHYTAILEPSAVLDLVGFLFYDFAGTAVLDKRSCLTDRIGQEDLRREHHAVGRRLSSAATRRALRRRRRSTAESFAGGSRRAAESGLLARHREKNEEPSPPATAFRSRTNTAKRR